MKKYALVAIAIAALSLSANAQVPNEQNQPKVRMGLSVAPVISWFNTDGNSEFVNPDGPRFNISYGLHADFALGTSQNYYFSTGIFQTNLGGTIQHEYFVREDRGYKLTSRTTDYRINYVEVPLTLMLRTNEIGYIRYFGRVGANMGFNFKSTYDSKSILKDNPSAESRNQEDESATKLTNLLRMGLHLELGFEFNLTGNTNAVVGVEWNNGLNNVFDKSYKLPTGEVNSEGFLVTNPDTGEPYTDRKVKSSINYVAVRVGVYF